MLRALLADRLVLLVAASSAAAILSKYTSVLLFPAFLVLALLEAGCPFRPARRWDGALLRRGPGLSRLAVGERSGGVQLPAALVEAIRDLLQTGQVQHVPHQAQGVTAPSQDLAGDLGGLLLAEGGQAPAGGLFEPLGP